VEVEATGLVTATFAQESVARIAVAPVDMAFSATEGQTTGRLAEEISLMAGNNAPEVEKIMGSTQEETGMSIATNRTDGNSIANMDGNLRAEAPIGGSWMVQNDLAA
jgi:hypothetical protein